MDESAGQPIHAIGDVDGIRGAGDKQHREQDEWNHPEDDGRGLEDEPFRSGLVGPEERQGQGMGGIIADPEPVEVPAAEKADADLKEQLFPGEDSGTGARRSSRDRQLQPIVGEPDSGQPPAQPVRDGCRLPRSASSSVLRMAPQMTCCPCRREHFEDIILLMSARRTRSSLIFCFVSHRMTGGRRRAPSRRT